MLGGLSLLKSGASPRTWGAREQVEGGDVGEVRGSILGQVQECPVGSVPAHTHTNLSTPFPVFLIIPPVLLLCSSRCCDPAAGEELEICIVFVLWEIPNTGDTHSFPMLPVFLSYV